MKKLTFLKLFSFNMGKSLEILWGIFMMKSYKSSKEKERNERSVKE